MIEHFSYEGIIHLIINGELNEELHGKVENSENDRDRRLRIIFDTSNFEEKKKFDILGMRLKLLQFSSNCAISVSMIATEGYYISSLDCRFCWKEKDSIVFLMQDNIVSTNNIGGFPDFSRLEFTGIKFRLESNRNVRRVLKNHINFEMPFGLYLEEGNQYSRSVSLIFSESKRVEECKKIIKAIVQSRTIIDGFQNYEADIILLQENHEVLFNYLSRRQVNKFRWFDDSRLNVTDPRQYTEIVMLILSLNSRQDKRRSEVALDTCEYLHQPNYSLPTSRFLEMITAFEGYAKQIINLTKGSSNEKWESLKVDLKNVIESSDYEQQAKKRMRRRVKLINPDEEKLKKYLEEMLEISLDAINSANIDVNYNDLLCNIVEIRNRLVHNPAEYFNGTLFVGNQLIETTCLLRELTIILLLTQESSFSSSFLKDVLRNATDLRKFIDSKLDALLKMSNNAISQK